MQTYQTNMTREDVVELTKNTDRAAFSFGKKRYDVMFTFNNSNSMVTMAVYADGAVYADAEIAQRIGWCIGQRLKRPIGIFTS